jgi:hypothetical protein
VGNLGTFLIAIGSKASPINGGSPREIVRLFGGALTHAVMNLKIDLWFART